MTLSPKQKRFIDEYSLDHNASRAARVAGYAEKSAYMQGSRLMKNDEVLAALADRQASMQQDFNITRERVIKELQDAIEIAKVNGNPAAMISGWTQIAKIAGLIAPERKTVTINTDSGDELARMEKMTDAELMVLARGD